MEHKNHWICWIILALLPVLPAAAQTVALSEVRIDQSSTDLDEFFELAGTPGTLLDGLTYLVIGDGSAGSGVIENVTDLTGLAIPASGYFVAAESTFTLSTPDFVTSLNFENSDNVTHALVRNFSGASGDDLDVDDDGTLDVLPWSELVDLIALVEEDNPPASTEFHYGPPQVGPDGSFVPSHAWFCPAGWEIGSFSAVGSTDTPGAANPCAVDVSISEVRIDQSSTDLDEFFELAGAPGAPLDGLTYLVIGDGTGGSGVIENVTDLSGLVIPASGFFVAAESTFTLSTPDLVTSLNFENSDNVTHLVVRDFSGASGDDLDVDDDGTLDVLPWSELVDLIALVEENNPPASTEFHYGPPQVGPDGSFVPSHVFACPEGFEIGSFSAVGSTDTPGVANVCPEPEPPALVINEIDYDQPSTDASEFIEIKNVGTETESLGTVELVLVNGNGGSVYSTIALPAVGLAAGDYFVVCADPAATPECDLDVSPDTNLIQNGAPDAVALVVNGTVIDTVSYEGDTAAPYTEGSGSGLADSSSVSFIGISRFPDGADTDQNNVDLSPRCITPGEANGSEDTGCVDPSAPPIFEIFEIQGAGSLSPVEGQVVTTLDNVVTAVGTNLFFIQTPDDRADADANTSNGILVFTGGAPTVQVGDRVDVTGEVDEFFDLTEFTNGPVVTVLSSGNALPAVVDLDATTPSSLPQTPADLERFEGMRVAVASGLTSAPNDRFGDTCMVAAGGRLYREPGIEFPGLPGLPVWDGNPEGFEVNPDGLGGLDEMFTAETPLAVEGVLTFSFGDYQILPTEALSIGAPPALPKAVRDRGADEVILATQNLLRLFNDVDDGTGDPVTDTGEYLDRLTKFSLQVREILGSPDVLGVQEVENIDTLLDLAAQINADDASLVYTPVLVEGNDVGGIDVGFLVRDTVQILGSEQIGANELLTFDGSLLNDRPPLVLEARYVGSTGSYAFDFTVVVVHQRSLSGIDSTSSGPRVRQKRHEQAVFLSQWLGARQAANPEERIVVLGDFNAFQFTDGYVDVMGQVTGNPADATQALIPGTDEVEPNFTNQVLSLPVEEQYSFLFGCNAQVLDHILTSASTAPAVVDAAFGRSNADAPEGFFDDPSTALRNSDHDGMVLFLDAGPELSIEGDSCPGFVDFEIKDLVPGTWVVVFGSKTEGSFTLPFSQCSGTELDLHFPWIFGLARADHNGEVHFRRWLSRFRCDWSFQAMAYDASGGSCPTGNVVPLN